MQMRSILIIRLLACLPVLALVSCGSREGADRRDPGNDPASSADRPVSLANAPAAAPVPAGPKIVVLGDSLTAGLGLAPEEAYPAVLEEKLKAAGFNYGVVNAGISGDTSAGGLSRVDLALQGDVRVLIVALGGNDALRGLPVTQLKSNLSRIIERAQSRDIRVILAGMEAPTNWGDVYTKAFREVYASLAKEYNVPLVPFLLEGVAMVPELNQRDGIHPTAEGDRIIAETVWKVLKPVVERLPAEEGVSGS